MYRLENRLARLERYQEEEEEEDYPPTRYHLRQEDDPLPPPGTLIYHLSPISQGWVGIVGEDGVERVVRGKRDVSS